MPNDVHIITSSDSLFIVCITTYGHIIRVTSGPLTIIVGDVCVRERLRARERVCVRV